MENRLEKPLITMTGAGWAEFSIGDFSHPVSLVMSDIPTDCLLAAKSVVTDSRDFVINLGTEGKGDIKLIADDFRCYLIWETDPTTFRMFDNINNRDIIEWVIKEFGDKNNLKKWVAESLSIDPVEEKEAFDMTLEQTVDANMSIYYDFIGKWTKKNEVDWI